MGLFSSSSSGKGLTPQKFRAHHIYRKIRAVLPYGARGEKKIKALDDALDIEEDTVHHHSPRLARTLEEDSLEDKLKRLEEGGLITAKEAEKIRSIASEDLHS